MEMSSQSPYSDGSLGHRAVFLSYAREDSGAAQRIADALRSQGIEVWFDQSELRGGDVWDKTIRRQIKDCALFLPIISARTQARGEGYFRLEWKLAVERTHLMAEGVPFLMPVVVDETPEGAAIVPAEFLRVQWARLPGSLPTPQFVAQVRRMLESPGESRPASAPRTSTGAVPRNSGSRLLAIGGIVALLVAVAATYVIMKRHAPPAVAPPAVTQAVAPTAAPPDAVDPKSVAVLPFENMSEDKDNAFFSDGVHEDVLTNLSFVRDLHVVSRTSVMQYRGTTKPIKQIGKELGVAYVLEGSVRRVGNKVRVTGQLIDARTDEHVWAKAYDRDLTDIFAIQGELAQAIADALQSVLSPETKMLLARRPTENAQAYDDYVKARQLFRDDFLGTQEEGQRLLAEAVRLDPGFAQAWGQLGARRAFLHFGGEETKELLDSAKDAIDTAVRLAPDDPEVIENLGDYYYYGFRDYPRATEQYMRLEQLRPNDAVVSYSLGLIQRRQGRVADALPNLQRGLSLDPTNPSYVNSYAEALVAIHHYDEALGTLGKYVDQHPSDILSAWRLSLLPFLQSGSTAAIKAFAQRTVPAGDQSLFLYVLQASAAYTGDWSEFVRIDHVQRYFAGSSQDSHWNEDTNAAEAFAEMGDMEASRKRATEALAELNARLPQQLGNAALWADLAVAHALLGEKEETLSAAEKAMELLPESRDAIAAPANLANCAIAHAWIGEKDRALAELDHLLRIPFGYNIYSARTTWRPLRDDPRFKKMMADTSVNGPLL
jgi:TolB-like protein/Tfp pilus assembly protein PilF